MRILGIAAAGKQGGKSSAAKFIFASELKKLNLLERFDIDNDGNLVVPHDAYSSEDGTQVIEAGEKIINLDCKDPQFIQWMAACIWPHTKIYHFADVLKYIAIHMYGIEEKLVYGSEKDKEELTPYTYKSLEDVIPAKYFPKSGDMSRQLTVRKFLQYLGDILRSVNDDCFTNPLIKQLSTEQCPLSLIADVRRVSEVEAIHKLGGKVMFLTRKPYQDGHRVEMEFNKIEKPEEFFDIVIDNKDMTIEQKNVAIYTELRNISWL
jgi:hypothetical protein